MLKKTYIQVFYQNKTTTRRGIMTRQRHVTIGRKINSQIGFQTYSS